MAQYGSIASPGANGVGGGITAISAKHHKLLAVLVSLFLGLAVPLSGKSQRSIVLTEAAFAGEQATNAITAKSAGRKLPSRRTGTAPQAQSI